MKNALAPELMFHATRVAEAAARACAVWIGRGKEKDADHAAVEAMRQAFDECPFAGTVVIGEGERDEAPMLYIGEKVGKGGVGIAIALDPLEGTTITAKGLPGAMTTLAIAPEGGLLHAPDVYMDKLAVGPGLPGGVIDLRKPIGDNIKAVAKAKGVDVKDITVCVLERDRHEKLIGDIRATGARLHLIGDGDVGACIATTDAGLGIDLYAGTGGAPEGVLAAGALKCVGGQFQGKLLFRNDDEKARATKAGVKDFDRIYHIDDLVPGDVIFVATGVTTGALLDGVQVTEDDMTTETLLLHFATSTSQRILTTVPR